MTNETPEKPTQAPWYERAYESVDYSVRGAFGKATDMAAESIHEGTEGGIHREHVKTGMPIAAAIGTGLLGMVLIEPLTTGGKWLMSGARAVVTGGGYLEKIPVVGKVFSGLGWATDKIGEYSGWAFSGVASLLAYKAFMPSVQYYDAPDNENTPNSGTGAVPQPSIRHSMSVHRHDAILPETTQDVPVSPQPVPPVEVAPHELPTPELDEARTMTYAQLRERRSGYLAENIFERQEVYRRLMQAQNQEFENRVQFIKDAREFEGTPTSNSPRNQMVSALHDRIGLTEDESQALIVRAPDLRVTVYSGSDETQDHNGGNGISADGNFPQSLVDFAHSFEDTYGKGYIWVAHRDGSGWQTQTRVDGKEIDPETRLPKKWGIAFDEMSVTQKVEYLEKAIDFTRKRYEYFEKNHKRSSSGMVMAPSSQAAAYASAYYTPNIRTWYDYYDRSQQTWRDVWFSNKKPPIGTNHYPGGVLSWKDEHEFLQGINGDVMETVRIRYGQVSGPSYGTGLDRLNNGFDSHQAQLDAFKEDLKRAETQHDGKIARYKEQAQWMEQSLNILRQYGVALVKKTHYQTYTSEDHIEMRDVRCFNPTLGNFDETSKWVLVGKMDGNIFRMTSFHGDNLPYTPLETPIEIDLSNGNGMKQVIEKIETLQAAQKATASLKQTPRFNVMDVNEMFSLSQQNIPMTAANAAPVMGEVA